MKNLLLVALLMIGFLNSTQAQGWDEITLDRDIDGVAFDSIAFHKVVETADEVRLYFAVSKIGAIRRKIGPIWQGGADPARITGMAQIRLSTDLNVIEEKFVLIQPDEIGLGKMEILAAPVKLGRADVIATQDDLVSRGDLDEAFPELKPEIELEEEEDMSKKAQQIYKNSIGYKGFLQKVQSFKQNKQVPKTEKEEKKLGLLDIRGKLEEQYARSGYKMIKNEISLEDYRQQDKTTSWVMNSGPANNQINGQVIAHHGKNVKKQKLARYLTQELVCFDAQGKVINRVDLEFDTPKKAALATPIFSQATNKGLYGVEGMVYIFADMPAKGAVKKQFGDKVKPHVKTLYQVNGNGELVREVTFETDKAAKLSFAKAIQKGERLQVLAYTTDPFSIKVYTFMDNALTNEQNLTTKDAVLAGLTKGAEQLTYGYQMKLMEPIVLKNGEQLLVFDIYKRATASVDGNGGAIYRGKGWIAMDKEGTVKGSSFWERGKNYITSIQPRIYQLDSNEQNISWLLKDEVSNKDGLRRENIHKITIYTNDYTEQQNSMEGLKNTSWMTTDKAMFLIGEQEQSKKERVYKLVRIEK